MDRMVICAGFVALLGCESRPTACDTLQTCCASMTGAAASACTANVGTYRGLPNSDSYCSTALQATLASGGCGTVGLDAALGLDGGLDASLPQENTPAACSDGISNDSDADIDCEDSDCCSVVACGPESACGRLDSGVSDARTVDAGPRDSATRDSAARDGSASDGGRRDAGPCTSGEEATAFLCTDGCSNDGDSFTDCDDYDCCDVVTCPAESACGRRASCVRGPENTVAACTDECSNDADGYVDCDDYDCCDVVACPADSSCGMRALRFVSEDPADCVGTGTASYVFGGETYSMRAIAIPSSGGYTIFGYTRSAITSGPFPLTGMSGERQMRVGPSGGSLLLALGTWSGSSWSSSVGGEATFGDESIVSLAPNAEEIIETHACVGFLQGTAAAPILGGVDTILFEFTAPVLGGGFPGL